MENNYCELQRIKEIELDMFKEILKICEELQLNYYLLGGTLLGSVRHKGFIPWDDDIDIGMLRNDYNIFIKNAQKYLPKNLFVQTYLSDKEMPINFCKIRNTETTFIESNISKLNVNHGIFIDIFPLDYYNENKLFDFKMKLYNYKISKIIYKKEITIKNLIKDLFTLFASPKKCIELKDKLMKSYKNGKMLANHCGAWGKKEIMPIDWFGLPKEGVFEGIKVKLPCEYDKYLTQVYGDYMKFPPIEKRITHHNTDVIDTTTSYKKYIM